MLGLQSRDHAKKRKENTSWSQATFVYFRAMPTRHLTPALVACRCHPPPLHVVAPSTDYEYLMFLGARRSCGQSSEATSISVGIDTNAIIDEYTQACSSKEGISHFLQQR